MAIVDINGNSIQQGGGESILNLKSTEGTESLFKSYLLKEYATSIEEGKRADGSSNPVYNRYLLKNVQKGDVILTNRSYNGEANVWFYADGIDLSKKATSVEFTVMQFIADKDYPEMYVANCEDKPLLPYIKKIDDDMKNLPSFNNKYIPMLNDSDNDVETMSSKLFYDKFGQSFFRAKEKLEGGVFIGFGDSYTHYADSAYRGLAQRYGMIYDAQGKVSSTICGDDSGSKGFAPFWSRMDGFIAEYTGAGRVINDVTYHADDVKLIVFMGGANDGYGTDTWLGKPFDKDTSFIYGSCNYMFDKLLETFKNAKVIVILQPVNYHADVSGVQSDEVAQKMGFTDLAELQKLNDYELGQYAMTRKEKVIKEVAERFGLTIVDCVFNWHNVLNEKDRKEIWATDTLHLTTKGTTELTEKLEKDGILKVFGN